VTETPAPLELAAGFPPADAAHWRALVEKALAGAPFEKLVAKTYDSISVKPLYTEADWPAARDASGAPGAAPFTRGGAAIKDQAAPWLIRQVVSRPDPEAANKEALADLEGGVHSIEFKLDRGDRRGVRIRSARDVAIALEGIMLDLAPLALDGGADAAAAALFADYAEARNLGEAAFAFNLDPLAALLTGQAAPLTEAIAFAKRCAGAFPNATSLRADARPAHEAGGSEAQELGYALAAMTALLRAGEAGGMAPEALARQCLLTFAIGPDIHLELAKLRAARTLFARLLEACGAAPEARAVKLHAVTGARMMTRRDAWVNLIRVTAAGFAAGVGGADVVTTAPLTEALGQPTPFARRIARNTQILLLEESNLGRVADPAGGAWAIETLTDDLARAGWTFFQAIEMQGGFAKAIESGWLPGEIGKTREARIKNVRRRRDAITGVSEFPLIGETPVIAEPWPGAAAPLTSKLPPMRLAAPFEALRDAADKAGNPPIFLATIGPLAQFSARATFAKSFFEAGGLPALGAEDAHEDDAAIIAAFKRSGAKIACLCASDPLYGERAEALTKALKQAGAVRLYLAGRGGEKEAAYKAAGVDDFIFAGGDAIAALEDAHRALGV
jgi:methylmalonyl-CoA mutase